MCLYPIFWQQECWKLFEIVINIGRKEFVKHVKFNFVHFFVNISDQCIVVDAFEYFLENMEFEVQL